MLKAQSNLLTQFSIEYNKGLWKSIEHLISELDYYLTNPGEFESFLHKEQRIAVAETMNVELTNENTKLVAENDSLRAELMIRINQYEDLKKEFSKYKLASEHVIAQLRQENTLLKQQNNELRRELARLYADKKLTREELEVANGTIDSQTMLYNQLVVEHETQRTYIEELLAAQALSGKSLTNETELRQSLQVLIVELKQQLAEKSSEIHAIKQQLKAAQAHTEVFSDNTEQLQQDYDAALRRINKLERENAELINKISSATSSRVPKKTLDRVDNALDQVFDYSSLFD